MSQETVDSEPKEDRLADIEARLTKAERQVKGVKGQVGLIRSKVGMGRPGEELKADESSPGEASGEAKEPKSSREEAAKPAPEHQVFSFMKKCAGKECGLDNPAYKEPELWCAGCGVPLEGDKQHLSEVKGCWNCDGKKDPQSGDIIVKDHAPRSLAW